MLPERSSRMSTSGGVELNRAVSSPPWLAAGANRHAIASRAAAKRFRRVIKRSYRDMVEISTGP